MEPAWSVGGVWMAIFLFGLPTPGALQGQVWSDGARPSASTLASAPSGASVAPRAATGSRASDPFSRQDLPSIEEMADWAGSESEEDARRLREGILQRVTGADPAAATLWIQLLSVVEGTERSHASAAVRAVGLADDRQGRAGSELILEARPEEAAEGGASLLALAALLSDPEDPAHAAGIRARLIADHPEAPETPEARLLLARFYLSSEGRRPEGLRMLEELIVQTPEHPVAPEARRLYRDARDGNVEPGDGGAFQ